MKEGNPKKKKKTVFQALFVPLLLVIVFQSILFYLVSNFGGISRILKRNSVELLTQQLLTKQNNIENLLNDKHFNLSSIIETIDKSYNEYEIKYAIDDINEVEFLRGVSDSLVKALRDTQTNGIYLILNNNVKVDSNNVDEKRYGICIRDLDQTNIYESREDILVIHCPSSIVGSLSCPLDSSWEPMFTITDSSSFYNKPIDQALINNGKDSMNLAYFSANHQINPVDPPMVSLSVPLISRSGIPYGVLGVELTKEYLSSLLFNQAFSSDQMNYLLTKNTGNLYSVIALPPMSQNKNFENDSLISLKKESILGCFTAENKNKNSLIAQKVDLDILPSNSPYEDSSVNLLVVVEKNSLFSYIHLIQMMLFFTALLCSGLGILSIVLVSRNFSNPIKDLTEKVKKLEPRDRLKLDRLGINEIDQLIDAIEVLNISTAQDIARTEFFSRMSHDMRTPMNAIISFSSPTLLEGVDEQTKDSYLEKINLSGNYLLGLINEVLDLTKIESNKVSCSYTSVQATTMLSTVCAIITELSKKKGQSFKMEIHGPTDLWVETDIHHTEQIVMNLLSNAVKFTDKGGSISLRLSFEDSSINEDEVLCRIEVQDNGIGISEEFMPRLFVPFEQENSGEEGSGLGLSITNKLVELMSGNLTCQSSKGKGSLFIVVLPLKKGKCKKQELLAEKGSESLKDKRLLVCEDNKVNATIIQHLLKKLQIQSVLATDGLMGLEIFKDNPVHFFDGILMDIRMPKMNGIEATIAIRALDRADAQSVPIIAMTADAFDNDVQKSLEAGMNEHLAKPINMDLFIKTLIRYL